MTLLKEFWIRSSQYRIIIVAVFCSIWVVCSDLQRHMPLARFQKYGIAIGIFGAAYLLQLILNWRHLSFWARLSNVTTAIFFSSVGYVFYSNPWLDPRVSVRTEEHDIFRFCLLGGYFIFAIIISCIWYKRMLEEAKTKATTGTAINK